MSPCQWCKSNRSDLATLACVAKAAQVFLKELQKNCLLFACCKVYCTLQGRYAARLIRSLTPSSLRGYQSTVTVIIYETHLPFLYCLLTCVAVFSNQLLLASTSQANTMQCDLQGHSYSACSAGQSPKAGKVPNAQDHDSQLSCNAAGLFNAHLPSCAPYA